MRHLLTIRESPQKNEAIAKAENIIALLKKTIIFNIVKVIINQYAA